MNKAMLKERFFEMLSPPLPNDWEVEENLDQLTDLDEERQELILRQVGAIWPVSNSLCYSYLAYADTALSCLNKEQVAGWVATILDIYEKEGLKAAQAFMNDVENNYLCLIRGETGIRLSDISSRLLPYAKGIHKNLESIDKADTTHTDTAAIYLPGKLAVFSSEEENFLLYKLMLTTQLSLIKIATYQLELKSDSLFAGKLASLTKRTPSKEYLDHEDIWDLFPEPRLAEDIFTLAEGWRINNYLKANYPGLWRDTEKIRQQLINHRPPLTGMPEKSKFIEVLARYLISGEIASGCNIEPNRLHRLIEELDKPADSAAESVAKLISVYGRLGPLKGSYEAIGPVIYLGRLQPAAARRIRLQKRNDTRDKFIKALAAVLPENFGRISGEDEESIEEIKQHCPSIESEQATALLIASDQEKETDSTQEPENKKERSQNLIVEGQNLELTDELKELSSRIREDLGQIPDEYISAAFGLAGSGLPRQDGNNGNKDGPPAGAITYDEWDFRRGGFRKNWCLLNEKKVLPVKGTFVQNTLEKYKGLLIKLKKQFEMLRSTERLLKRQREGDDIDLDAVVESISDIRAGRPESEKVFVRLRRDERDIAVLFLIDMSASTEGWIGEALKEALILMGESLEVLGDRFAIAGFSGMRRTRSDFYHIKDFDDKYGEESKNRIAAITPQEYTRMGPPLRHATKILEEVDARAKMLIVLSDGKPEDYDDYKGDYAIEDTRHALIEAKAAGIHPFCITIDQQAHNYNAHMYGEVNYIFLDKIRDLPIRMPAIYRHLTT